MPVWETEMSWSRSFISTGAALALLVMAVLGPFTGYAVDRWGARWLLTAGLVLTGMAMFLVSLAQSQSAFILAYSLLGALGFGLVSMNAVSTAAAQSMPDQVGLASGVATAGSTGGQLFFVPVLAAVVAASGWRSGYLTAGMACFALAPVVWWLIASRPAARANDADSNALSFKENIKTVLRSPVFLVLFATFFICGVTTAGVIETHLIPYAAACGFSAVSSASAYGLLSAFNLFGMIAAGWLSDRIHRGRLLAFIYFARAGAFVLLMSIGTDYELLLLFAVIFGIVDYSTVPVTASLVAARLGLHRLGLSMGVLVAGHSVGAAVGAYLGGALFDQYARYDALWMVSITLALIAGLMALSLREPRAPDSAGNATLTTGNAA